MRVVVIAPLGYRLLKDGRLLYRQPDIFAESELMTSFAEITDDTDVVAPHARARSRAIPN